METFKDKFPSNKDNLWKYRAGEFSVTDDLDSA